MRQCAEKKLNKFFFFSFFMAFVVSTKTFIFGDLKKGCGRMLMFSYLTDFRSWPEEDLLKRDKCFVISFFPVSQISSRTFHFSGAGFIRRVQISGKGWSYTVLFVFYCAWCFWSRLFGRSTCQQRKLKSNARQNFPTFHFHFWRVWWEY